MVLVQTVTAKINVHLEQQMDQILPLTSLIDMETLRLSTFIAEERSIQKLTTV